jgi:hypothetical protein
MNLPIMKRAQTIVTETAGQALPAAARPAAAQLPALFLLRLTRP